MTGEMSDLRRYFLIPELEEEAQGSGVDGTVVVQARQTTEETAWLLNQAARHPLILGVVGWVPLTDQAVEEHLDRFASDRTLKAVRHVIHDEPDDSYMLRDDFNRGVDLLQRYGLVYDILIFERHLPQAIMFVDRHPGQVFVVDHIAKPRIRDGVLSPWRERIAELAKRENVYCKVSGMVTEADWDHWTADELRTYFDIVLAAFGPKRLMFGSDWPVLTLASTYSMWMKTYRGFISGLSTDEQHSICQETATVAYHLKSTQ